MLEEYSYVLIGTYTFSDKPDSRRSPLFTLTTVRFLRTKNDSISIQLCLTVH